MSRLAPVALALVASISEAGEVELESHDLASPLVRVYELPPGHVAAEKPNARRARVAGYELVLVDVDGNGSFDETAIDGWTLAGHAFLFPLEGAIVLGSREIRLSIVDGVLHFETRPPEIDETTAALLDACNRQRMHQGVAPLRLDPPRTRGCRDHALYMDRWGITKRPEPDREGYTDAGARAAAQGLLMRAARPQRVVATVFASFPNRIWLFHPLLDRIGVAESERHVALDIAAPLSRRRLRWPVLLPAPGSIGNPTTLTDTEPKLFGGAAHGLPITLQFPGTEIRVAEADLRVGGKKGPQVEALVGTPGSPAHSAISGNAECICIVPREPLARGARYFVRVKYAFRGEPGEREWEFATEGPRKGRPQPETASPKLPERAPLRLVRMRKVPLTLFGPEGDLAERPAARQVKLGAQQVILLDLDGNGSFGDVGVDGWTQKGLRYAFPLEQHLVLGEKEYQVAVVGEEMRFRAATIPVKEEYRKAVAAWNVVRMRNGLPPVSLRHDFCVAAERHAAYMDRHGLGRREQEGKPGFSEDGARAGARGALAPVADPFEALRLWEQRFANRHLVFAPDAAVCGIGTARGHSVFDTGAEVRRRSWHWPVIIPAPESEGCPVSYEASNPPLFPEVFRTPESSGLAGLPITLHFPEKEARFEQVEAELRRGGKNGKPVEILVAWPEKPAHPELVGNNAAILLLPRKHLKRRTRYDATVHFVRDGRTEEIRWWFKTGKR